MTAVWTDSVVYSLLYWEYDTEDGLLQGCAEFGFISASQALRRAIELGLTEFRIDCSLRNLNYK